MSKKNLMNGILAVIFAVIPVLVFTVCDMPTADASLDGSWIAVSGAKLEFTSGKYTKTLVTGAVETGTFTADKEYLTFNRYGDTPRVLPYKLDGIRLTVDITDYFRNTPGTPDNIEGRWAPYPEYGPAVIFGAGKPRKGNPGIVEGDFIDTMNAKGQYSITNRNLPGSNVLKLTPTHLHGSNIGHFVQDQLRVSLVELFDVTLLQTPAYDINEWWFTIDEARLLFENAAGRAPNLEDQARIISAMKYFFALSVESYDYSIENDDELRFDYEAVEKTGMNKLTLRGTSSWGVFIRTFFRIKEDWSQLDTGVPHNPEEPDEWYPGWYPKPPVEILF